MNVKEMTASADEPVDLYVVSCQVASKVRLMLIRGVWMLQPEHEFPWFQSPIGVYEGTAKVIESSFVSSMVRFMALDLPSLT